MKPALLPSIFLLLAIPVAAEDAADGLDLSAVLELSREVENVEQLERKLNDPDLGINNLDLNGDGDVDYLRAVDRSEGDLRVVVLQAAVAEDEYRDVATVEIDRDESGEVAMQVQGDVVIYGPDYYVVPVGVRVTTWPLVVWLYSPHYHVWVSPFHWHRHPYWWRPWRVVPGHVYRPRVTRYTQVNVNVTNVNHVPHASRAAGVRHQPTAGKKVRANKVGAASQAKKTPAVHKQKGAGGTKAKRNKKGKPKPKKKPRKRRR